MTESDNSQSQEAEQCIKCGTQYDLEQTDEGFTMCVDCLVGEVGGRE